MKDFFSQAKTYLCVCLLLLVVSCTQKPAKYSSVAQFSEDVKKQYINHLSKAIENLDSMEGKSIKEQQKHYVLARKYFKLAEPILAFSDKDNYKSLNAPNIIGVHGETTNDTRVINPIGFQVIEETIYDDDSDFIVLKRAINVTSNRLKLIKKNVTLKLKGYHVMWLIRDQITRVATAGITGFDSPVLNQSLVESSYTYETLLDIIKLNENKFTSKALFNKFEVAVKSAQKSLNHDFDTFDRFNFIKNHTNPQLKILLEIQKDWEVKYPFEMALSNNMSTLFSDKTLNINYFSDHLNDTTKLAEKIVFGKQLFNDTSLSKNYDMACATCHIKDLAFTDGRKTFDENQTRNSPTLTYAAYQRSFFMDARAGSLEGQVVGVVENHNEFNMSMDSVVQRVYKNKEYKKSIINLYGAKRVDFNIRHAIASYIRTLNMFDSKFDKNIRGEEETLTADEKQGFNLFMGKALCASCHFAPVFNGTVPPNYNDTELEFIGVPESTDSINPKISTDLGRYALYKTPERKHFFKTPTVRNIAKTAPYMHNGVYKTLEEVMDFYNKGGGAGLGFDTEYQTLPFDSLSLSKKEISQIIDFMNTLTDETY
ncbi:methylamine utilization protein [Tenacibaculum pacificus]|uniref:cytochrome-c peroxidase n=1 Tax=Tenacibaculum pacificus TaxID=3018314 RepID=UPI0022F3F6AD|nr:cytochrome c peroxidase [Tenacibaculum pacificus]WBX74334.1 methylamine utilization protein [Tenacibaculum pacificus]